MSQATAEAEAPAMTWTFLNTPKQHMRLYAQAGRMKSIEELIEAVVNSEFMPGGHFMAAPGTVRTVVADEAVLRERAAIVAELLTGEDICLRGQLLIRYFCEQQVDAQASDTLESVSAMSHLGVHIGIHAHGDIERLVLHWCES